MKAKAVWVGLLVAVLTLAGCVAVPVQPQGVVNCLSDFEATIRQGPNAGLSLNGQLALRIEPSGAAQGVLRQADGTDIPVVGQVDGRAINLAFGLAEGRYIFGVGTGTEDVRSCSGAWGGPFAGPEPGDSGDWGTIKIKICTPLEVVCVIIDTGVQFP